MEIPLAELIRDLRSERVGQGRKVVKANSEYGNSNEISNANANGKTNALHTQNPTEQSAMRGFANLATSPAKWRFIMILTSLAPLGAPFASFVPLLNKWVKYRAFPKVSGGLHAKVQKMQGVIYE